MRYGKRERERERERKEREREREREREERERERERDRDVNGVGSSLHSASALQDRLKRRYRGKVTARL